MTPSTPPAAPSVPVPGAPGAGCFLAAAPPRLAPAQADQARTFSGVALSGQPLALSDGPPLVIDLASLSLPPAVPVLVQHDREQRVGLATLVAREDHLHASGRLLSNPRALALAADADEGFPWQLSVHVAGGQVATVAAGAGVTVNGRALAGPLLLWRQARVRELSFTPTGVDDQTSALVLAQAWPPGGAASAPPLSVLPPETAPMTDPFPAAAPAGTALAAPGGTALAAPGGAPGDPPAAPTAAVARLEAQLAAAEGRIQAAEQALLQAVRARREARVTQAFAALGLAPPAASLPHWLALADDALDALLADLGLAADRGAASAGLFAEQATAGQPAASDAALIDRMAQL